MRSRFVSMMGRYWFWPAVPLLIASAFRSTAADAGVNPFIDIENINNDTKRIHCVFQAHKICRYIENPENEPKIFIERMRFETERMEWMTKYVAYYSRKQEQQALSPYSADDCDLFDECYSTFGHQLVSKLYDNMNKTEDDLKLKSYELRPTIRIDLLKESTVEERLGCVLDVQEMCRHGLTKDADLLLDITWRQIRSLLEQIVEHARKTGEDKLKYASNYSAEMEEVKSFLSAVKDECGRLVPESCYVHSWSPQISTIMWDAIEEYLYGENRETQGNPTRPKRLRQ